MDRAPFVPFHLRKPHREIRLSQYTHLVLILLILRILCFVLFWRETSLFRDLDWGFRCGWDSWRRFDHGGQKCMTRPRVKDLKVAPCYSVDLITHCFRLEWVKEIRKKERKREKEEGILIEWAFQGCSTSKFTTEQNYCKS